MVRICIRIRQSEVRCGYKDPDPFQIVTVPEHWLKARAVEVLTLNEVGVEGHGLLKKP
jgi:hypothetical protein